MLQFARTFLFLLEKRTTIYDLVEFFFTLLFRSLTDQEIATL